MGRSIRLVVVALVVALTVAACGGKQEEAPQAAAPSARRRRWLSHTLQLHPVAEGIEHAGQATHLAALGCQDGQGYLFAAADRRGHDRAAGASGRRRPPPAATVVERGAAT